MAKSVTTIPATLSRFTAAPINSTKKRRVAAYARVSTDNEEQLTSYEAQVDYYTNYIQGRDDWEFAGVYTDEGITGTNTKKREGFKSMVADALAGKFDLIITKSVSRFARNTVDSLTTIRKLKEHCVEVYFEKENIWTFDSKGELLLTILSSLAQEESRSISENCTWGQRKRFADGKVTVPFKRFLGYDMGPDRNLVVNPEQAKLVKRIYGMFLLGKSPFQIASTLTEEGIPSQIKFTWPQCGHFTYPSGLLPLSHGAVYDPLVIFWPQFSQVLSFFLDRNRTFTSSPSSSRKKRSLQFAQLNQRDLSGQSPFILLPHCGQFITTPPYAQFFT